MPSNKTIERLSLYRSLLNRLLRAGESHVYSHELSTLAGNTPSQVRRDLMAIGFTGTPTRGYEVRGLIDSIGDCLDAPDGEPVALVGVGNLGGAILGFFVGRRPKLSLVAAFDEDRDKAGRVLYGVHCYPMDKLAAVIASQGIHVAVITVPASEAQGVADRLVRAGVRGILNFAPVRLRVPADIYVEDVDVTMALEKVAYFARQNPTSKGQPPW
jgi:redox-sensing transcriptional repressor